MSLSLGAVGGWFLTWAIEQNLNSILWNQKTQQNQKINELCFNNTFCVKYNNHKTKIVLLAWAEMKGIAFLRVYKDVHILICYGIFF